MAAVITYLNIILEALNAQTVGSDPAAVAAPATGSETIGSLLTPRTPERI
jgi:hypothetical protein